MINEEQIIGKRVCLVLMSKDEQGKDDWAVLKGEIIFQNGDPMFRNYSIPTPFSLPADTLQRIKVPADEIRSIVLNSDYMLCLSVGAIPNGENAESLINTGLKWPKDK